MQQRLCAICATLIMLTVGWASAQDFIGTFKETVYGIMITIDHDGEWFGWMESGGATFPLTLSVTEEELVGTWEIDDETVGFSATLDEANDLHFRLYEFTTAGEPDAATFENYIAERQAPAPRRSLGGALAGSASTPPSEPEPAPESTSLPVSDLLVIDGVWEAEADIFGVGFPAQIVYTFADGQFQLTLSLMGEQLSWYRGVYQVQAEAGATEGLISMHIVDYSPEMCFQGECDPVVLTDDDRIAVSHVDLLTPDTLRITEEDGAMDYTRTAGVPAPPPPASAPPAPPSAPPAPKVP